jgi:hypothetical protein
MTVLRFMPLTFYIMSLQLQSEYGGHFFALFVIRGFCGAVIGAGGERKRQHGANN